MHLCLVLLALVGLSVAAPQAAWPYPDSLLPYRYGYPGQGQYKYLPELEDDEEVGPYLSSHKTGRQDLVVGEGQSIRSQIKKKDDFWRYGDAVGAKPVVPTEVPGVTVVETGSVAPVKENEPGKVHAEPAAPPPKVTPVAISKPAEKPVQPPPFPPARPPPTEAPKEKEEDEEDDDSEEDDVEDVENVDDEHLHEQELEQDDEHDQEDDSEQDDDAEDDEEEDADDEPEEEDDDDDDRRRQAPLHDEVPSSVAPVVAPAPVVENASVKPVVVKPKEKPEVVENEVVVKPVVPPAPVVDTDDESSEEVAAPPVEALVPGYITEQGEVLVPVDTVIGDQPISIVDDPSTPPARGVPFRAPAYDGYRSPYYYPSLYRPDSSSQDESDELDDSAQNDETEEDVSAPVAQRDTTGRNGFLTSFPPSRTPELYALIESRIPVDSNVDFEDYQVYGGGKPAAEQKPYTQQRPFYNVPYSQPRPYGPYAQQQYNRPPFVPQYNRPPYVQQYNRPEYVPHQRPEQYSRPPYVQQRPEQYSRPPYAQQPYNRRPGQSQSFTVALAMSGNGAGYRPQQAPFRVQNQNQVVPIPVRSNAGYSGYNRYQGPYQPSPFYAPYNQNPFYRKPVYEPVYGGYVQPQYGPFRVGGYSPRPQVASQQQEEFPGTTSGGFRPQINNRIVIHGSGGQQSARPVPVPVRQYSRPSQGSHVGYRRPVSPVYKPGQVVKVPNPQKENKVKTSNKRRPTPVIKQADDEVYSYEPLVTDDSISVDSSADVADSYEHETARAPLITTVSKSRRIPKMAKKSKVNKKKVSATNSDPLNILKKSNSKSRRN